MEKEKSPYWVSVAVSGRVHMLIDAESPLEAKFIANEEISNLDFGVLKDIDWYVDNVKDEDETIVWSI